MGPEQLLKRLRGWKHYTWKVLFIFESPFSLLVPFALKNVTYIRVEVLGQVLTLRWKCGGAGGGYL